MTQPPRPITFYEVLFLYFHVLFIIIFTTGRNTWPSPQGHNSLEKFFCKLFITFAADNDIWAHAGRPQNILLTKNCVTYQNFAVVIYLVAVVSTRHQSLQSMSHFQQQVFLSDHKSLGVPWGPLSRSHGRFEHSQWIYKYIQRLLQIV